MTLHSFLLDCFFVRDGSGVSLAPWYVTATLSRIMAGEVWAKESVFVAHVKILELCMRSRDLCGSSPKIEPWIENQKFPPVQVSSKQKGADCHIINSGLKYLHLSF
jgi:hypothetical protein